MPRPNKPRYRADRDVWVSKIDGVLHTLAHGKRNRAAAVKALREILAAKATGSGAPKRTITVGELCDRICTWTRQHRSKLTSDWYKWLLQAFADHAGHETPAASIRAFHVSEWIESREWGQSTHHGAITAVKRAFRWGHRQGYLETNHLEFMEKPAMRRREAIMGPEDEQKVLAAIGGPLSDYLTFMHETGCRPSEVERMEAKHLVDGTVVMHGKTTARTKKMRTIYLTPVAAGIVARLVAKHPDGPIFRNTRGRPWTRQTLSKAMRRLRKRLGLGKECVAESFRHGWITDAKLKLPNAVVAELAGHHGTAMVDAHYGHINERRDVLAEAVNVVRSSAAGTASPPTSEASTSGTRESPSGSGTLADNDRTPRQR